MEKSDLRGVSNGAAWHEQRVLSRLDAALEHMGQREVRDVDVIVVELDTGTNGTGGVGDDVAVAEHGAFGVARGSAGEADGGEHVGLGGADGTGAGCAGGFNVIERDDCKVGVCALGGFVNSSHNNDVLEGAAGDGEGNLQLGGADNDGGEASVLDDVLHGVVAEGVVQGHSSDGLAVSSLLCKHPLRAVLRKEAKPCSCQALGSGP